MGRTDETCEPGDPRTHPFPHGRLSYVQIPAHDVHVSAAFYENVFGWSARGGSPTHFSFADATGDMIGAWVTSHAPAREPGVLLYIYVHGIDNVLTRITEGGGSIIREPYPEGDLWVATFADPAGNTLGVWQRAPR